MSLAPIDASGLNAFIRQRRFAEVHQACDRYLTSDESTEVDRKVALHLKGMVYYLQNNLTKSIDSFKAVLNLDPKFTDSAISLSIIYNDIGRYDEAKKVYNIANQSLALKRHGSDGSLDRNFALKHIEIGDLYFKYHRYDEALEDYLKAVRLDPLQVELRLKLAKVYAKKGFITRAVQELRQLCSDNPSFAQGRIHLGLMYFSLGNVIDAQQEWEKALAIDPSNTEIHTYLDMAHKATETSV